jgi:hypothetical protein
MARIVTITQEEQEVSNLLDPPHVGTNRGGGVHVTIPPDWQARIAAGEHVPGVHYYRRDAETGEIDAPDRLRAALDDAQARARVPARLTAALTTLDTKVRTAVVTATEETRTR